MILTFICYNIESELNGVEIGEVDGILVYLFDEIRIDRLAHQKSQVLILSMGI